MFKYTNPHPQGKRVGDCIKRACVLASGIDYRTISIMLNRWKHETNERDYWKSFIEKILLGKKDPDDMQHAFYGHRYTVDDYAKWWDEETAILRCSKHLVCCKNGDYFDTWDSGYKGVYIAWSIPAHVTILNNIKNNYPKICKNLF